MQILAHLVTLSSLCQIAEFTIILKERSYALVGPLLLHHITLFSPGLRSLQLHSAQPDSGHNHAAER